MASTSEEDRHLKLTGEFDCDPTPLATLRHSTSHVMAQAVKRLFPDVKVAIGPAIEDGFYYDFAKAEPFTPEDLARIESGHARDRRRPTCRSSGRRCRARRPSRFFRERGEPYKVEILEGIDADRVSLYTPGRLHRPLPRAARRVDRRRSRRFKLLVLVGRLLARATRSNPMLQRIYGTAWLTQEELDQHLWRLEEAKKRDHRKLGRELDLFDFHDVAPGAPFWLPNGMILVRELEQFARERSTRAATRRSRRRCSSTRSCGSSRGTGSTTATTCSRWRSRSEIFSLKPMNCPESTLRLPARAALVSRPAAALQRDGARCTATSARAR